MIQMRALMSAILLGLSIAASGCMDAARVNTTCRWSDSEPRTLDLSRASDRDHLRVDAQVAWELGLRFADVRYRNVPTRARPLLEQCRGALYDSIIRRHGVSRADIETATRARVWWADVVLVFLPLALLTLLVMDHVTRRICRAFDADDRAIATTSTVLLVPVVALVALGVTQIWAIGVESVLLRNGHVSGRASLVPVVAHGWTTYLGALALCMCIAAWRFRITPLTGSAELSLAPRAFSAEQGRRKSR
jgi:hypothetical protein